MPVSAAASAARRAALAEHVRAYRQDLRQRVRAQAASGGPGPEAVVLDYLERYRDQLFGHPVARDAAGRVVAIVERTNNPAEHFFSAAKRRLRRRLGRAHLGRDMEDQPAEVALVANLVDPNYVKILCGTFDALPQAFAELVQSGAATARPDLGPRHPKRPPCAAGSASGTLNQRTVQRSLSQTPRLPALRPLTASGPNRIPTR